MEERKGNTWKGFLLRFVGWHVLTYLIVGITFMLASDYFSVFAADPLLRSVMKPAEALSVRLAPLAQVVRGALLGAVLYPFRQPLYGRHGGAKLFSLLLVWTALGAVIVGPGSIEGLLYTRFQTDLLIGMPEVILQTAAFSWLFVRSLKKMSA